MRPARGQFVIYGEYVRPKTDVVHVVWDGNDPTQVSCCPDHWGDRAVVLEAEPCTEHDGCRVLTVAPDGTDTLEYPHITNHQRIGVTRE